MRPVCNGRLEVSEEACSMKPSQGSARSGLHGRPSRWCSPRETDLLDAVRVLVDRRLSGAPVVDERGNLVGVLTERDFLKAALVAGYHGERGGCVGDYMSRDVDGRERRRQLV